jgi:hypothetical protein
MLKQMTNRKIIILALLTYLPYLLTCQVIKKSQGTIEFVYEQDSVQHRYFLKSTIIRLNNKEHYFVIDPLMVMAKLDLNCDGKHTILSYNGNEKIAWLSELRQFQDSTQSMNGYSVHHGGDIYRVNTNTISIVFVVTAYFAILNEKPCEDFYYGKIYSCPIQYDKSFYPMAIMIGATKSKSLSRQERRKKCLKRFEHTFFEEGDCD